MWRHFSLQPVVHYSILGCLECHEAAIYLGVLTRREAERVGALFRTCMFASHDSSLVVKGKHVLGTSDQYQIRGFEYYIGVAQGGGGVVCLTFTCCHVRL